MWYQSVAKLSSSKTWIAHHVCGGFNLDRIYIYIYPDLSRWKDSAELFVSVSSVVCTQNAPGTFSYRNSACWRNEQTRDLATKAKVYTSLLPSPCIGGGGGVNQRSRHARNTICSSTSRLFFLFFFCSEVKRRARDEGFYFWVCCQVAPTRHPRSISVWHGTLPKSIKVKVISILAGFM